MLVWERKTVGASREKKILPQKSSLKIKIYLQNPVYTFFGRKKDKSIANLQPPVT